MKKTILYKIKFLGKSFSFEFYLARPLLQDEITAALKQMAEAEEITHSQHQYSLDILSLAPTICSGRTDCMVAGVRVGCIYIELINAFA